MEVELPDEWTLTELRDIGTFHKGRGGAKRDDKPEGVPVVRYGELYTHHHNVIRNFHSFVPKERAEDYTPLRRGDLLFAGAGETAEEIGKSAVFLGPEPAHGSGDMIIFRPDGRVDPLFLGYASNGRIANAFKRSVGQGSSILHIYARDLEALKLPLPPVPEQQKIAAILTSVDDAIAATRKAIEQTKRVKKGLLQVLLTHGIGHTRFKQTEIGEVPDNWQLMALSDVCVKIGVGIASSATHAYAPNGVPLIRNQNIADGRLLLDDLLHVEKTYADQHQSKMLRAGDVVTMRTGEPGRSAVIPQSLDGSQSFTTLIFRPGPKLTGPYLSEFLNSPKGRAQIRAFQAGGAQPNLNVRVARQIKLPLPPREEQETIIERLATVDSAVDCARGGRAQLETLKGGLMQDLLTGRVRVNVD